mgnify:FL=1
MLQTKQQILTIVELTSKRPNIEDSIEAGFLVSDHIVLEFYSSTSLPYVEVKERASSYDGFTITAIHEVSGEPEKF